MKLHLNNKVGRRGFTLVEMIGVLAVIAILTAMLIPKVFETINTARVNSASAAVNTVRNAVASHYSKYGGFAAADGTRMTPTNVATGGAAELDAASFDSLVLVNEGMLEKPFSVKIGDQTSNTLVRVRPIEAAADATAITTTSASYDLDGEATNVYTNDGSLVCEAVITGVTAADARALKELIDGSDLTAIANLPAVGSAATLGRVKYDAITAGSTGDVTVYITHR